MADKYSATYYEASAKTGENVLNMFKEVAKSLIRDAQAAGQKSARNI